MKSRISLMTVIGLTLTLAAAAWAQAPGNAPANPGQVDNTTPAGGAAAGTTAAAPAGGTAVEATTTSETTTTTTTPANTGGEPWLMALAGTMTMCSALWLRRKLA